MALNRKNHTKETTNPVALVTLMDQGSPISEQYRTIRTNIQFSSSADQEIKAVVVTSSGPGEGKSTTSANLAVVFANSGQKVLLIDADLRKPTIHKTFNLSNNLGFSNLISTQEKINNVVQKTGVENLDVLTSGLKSPNPSELLSSKRMDDILEELKNEYDLVIFDMPPIVAVTDAQIMSSKVDGTLLVIREEVSRKEALYKARDLLKLVNANVLGAIYHGAKNSADQGYYYYGS